MPRKGRLVLALTISPSFDGETLIEVRRDAADESLMVISCRKQDRPVTAVLPVLLNTQKNESRWGRQLSGSEGHSLMEMLGDCHVPPVPKERRWGLDGTTYQLQFGETFTISTFEWWMEAPKEWKRLEDICDTLIRWANEGFNDPDSLTP